MIKKRIDLSEGDYCYNDGLVGLVGPEGRSAKVYKRSHVRCTKSKLVWDYFHFLNTLSAYKKVTSCGYGYQVTADSMVVIADKLARLDVKGNYLSQW